MIVEGICKVYSEIGMEYQYGEFYVERDYLVFEQNYSYGLGKRHTYPLMSLRNIALIPEKGSMYLTFSCENTRFEITDYANELKPFLDELRAERYDVSPQQANKREKYTPHHHYIFAK